MDLDSCRHVDRRYHWKDMTAAWVADHSGQAGWVADFDKPGEKSVASAKKEIKKLASKTIATKRLRNDSR